jgi:hypothetical protein
MFWFWKRLFRRGFASQREVIALEGGLDHLARSGVGTWLMAQEKARLDFLAAKEAYTQTGTAGSLDKLLERLLQLQATNAVVQALINEHTLERLVMEPAPTTAPPRSVDIGKSR